MALKGIVAMAAISLLVTAGIALAQSPLPDGMVEAAFKKADADSDGKLDPAEFKTALQELRESIGARHAKTPGAEGGPLEILRKADADNNKEVTKEEMKKAFPNYSEDRFETLDRNKDGVLNQKDFAQPGQHPGASGGNVVSKLEKADADNDGKVTLDEARKVLPNLTEEGYKKMDRNGDGVLAKEDRPEPAAQPAPNKDAIKAKMKEADKNGDNKLSFEEAQTVFPNLTKEKFDKRDVNHDGFLSKEDRAK